MEPSNGSRTAPPNGSHANPIDNNHVSPNQETTTLPPKKKIIPRWVLAVIFLILLLLLAGAASLAWYFLEYRVWVLEPRVEQQYTAHVRILNRNFSSALSSHGTREFQAEAKAVQAMVKRLVKATDISRYFNSTTVFAFGEGSVVAHFWLALSVPKSHADAVTLQRVSRRLQLHLAGYSSRGAEDTAGYGGYLLHLSSFSITETDPKVVDLLKASFGMLFGFIQFIVFIFNHVLLIVLKWISTRSCHWNDFIASLIIVSCVTSQRRKSWSLLP
ncbi:transmembrane protease serine 6 [Clupea harengus]|uniref:Transmembrane protease serine 6 n=1 Tax=Clupea harengus TaxID=7950 RepID=A0A6P8F896_CLUHA|nr:transmembrane protease serine 6 [Clupea harengus]